MKRLGSRGFRLSTIRFGLAGAAAFVLCSGLSAMQAQSPDNAQPQSSAPPASAPSTPASESDKDQDVQKNPFAVEPAPPLPAGMTGSDANDPRFTLTPGLYDAGEASIGLRHVLLIKKPDAFQLGTDQPDDPKVKEMVGQLAFPGSSMAPKDLQLEIAQLAFSNSDSCVSG